MRYTTLGGTGIEVSAYCLGTMMFGEVGNPDHDDCVRILHAALDSGIDFVDTADMYSAGESEVIVGKALRGRRDEVVLATKGHFALGEGHNRSGNSRRWLTRALEDTAVQPDAFDMTRPENVAKREATERLAALAEDVGCTLPELAMAFPGAHPAVTSTIIGPRTIEQLEATLAGAGMTLDDATLDRIDEIVPPGSDLHITRWRPPALQDPALRRRAPA